MARPLREELFFAASLSYEGKPRISNWLFYVQVYAIIYVYVIVECYILFMFNEEKANS